MRFIIIFVIFAILVVGNKVLSSGGNIYLRYFLIDNLGIGIFFIIYYTAIPHIFKYFNLTSDNDYCVVKDEQKIQVLIK